jgi:hypothetical protein
MKNEGTGQHADDFGDAMCRGPRAAAAGYGGSVGRLQRERLSDQPGRE